MVIASATVSRAPLAVEILHGLPHPYPIETRARSAGALPPTPPRLPRSTRGGASPRPGGRFADAAPAGAPSAQCTMGRAIPGLGLLCCQYDSGWPLSRATSMARAARWRPPPRKPGSSRAAQRSSSIGSSRAVQASSERRLRRVQVRLGKEAVGERAHIQPGAAHDHGQLPPAANVGQPTHRVTGKVTRAVAAAGIDQVAHRDGGAGLVPSGWVWRFRCPGGGRPDGNRRR